MSGAPPDVLAQVVDRFLGYRMPDDFAPDSGVSFTPIQNPEFPDVMRTCWPTGTCLLTAAQARAMFEHLLAPLLARESALAELLEADRQYDAAIAALKDLNRHIAENGWLEVEFDALRTAGTRVVMAQVRREKALTAVDGAS